MILHRTQTAWHRFSSKKLAVFMRHLNIKWAAARDQKVSWQKKKKIFRQFNLNIKGSHRTTTQISTSTSLLHRYPLCNFSVSLGGFGKEHQGFSSYLLKKGKSDFHNFFRASVQYSLPRLVKFIYERDRETYSATRVNFKNYLNGTGIYIFFFFICVL